MCGNYLAILKNITIVFKTDAPTFWATFGINWATFYFIIWSH